MDLQNRYTGDIGDFAKYRLLRALAGEGADSLRLGVCWYLTLDERHTGATWGQLTDVSRIRARLPVERWPSQARVD